MRTIRLVPFTHRSPTVQQKERKEEEPGGDEVVIKTPGLALIFRRGIALEPALAPKEGIYQMCKTPRIVRQVVACVYLSMYRVAEAKESREIR
jgi:hypothetical protein